LAWKQAQPPLGDFMIGPSRDHIRASAQDDVHVIGQDGIGQHIEPKNRGEALQSLPDPFSAEVVIFACESIFAGQKSTPHTALDAVDDADFVRFEQFGA
jgi:hypothetical protein